MKRYSLDIEATGIDIWHGSAKPFFVTMMDEEENIECWEWDVNPITREPEAPEEDLLEIAERIREADELILQNAIYDASALAWYYDHRGIPLDWDWSKVRDTLYAGHLLASNEPHDLTTLGIRYLGYNIERYEKELEVAVKKCRSRVRNKEFIEKYGEWRIAKAGLPEMPSVKEKSWRADYWLPRAIAKAEGYPPEDPYWTVLSEYGNTDSSITLPIWTVQKREIEDRGLEKIYETRLKLLPIVYQMQSRGITLSRKRTEELITEFREGSEKSNRMCTGIAEGYGYDLTLPKSGNNKSLLEFIPVLLEGVEVDCEDEEGGTTKAGIHLPRTEKGNLSLDKTVLSSLEEVLPARSKSLLFVKNLRMKRKQDTAVSYLESYGRFYCPEKFWKQYARMHPWLNATGSKTLRWSSSNPNEQNISKQEDFNLRYGFGPLPDREWWSLDAKNIELRIPGYESEEQELIDLFERADEPPYYGSEHLLNFSTVYPEIWEAAVREVGIEKAGPYCKKKYASTYYQWCKNGDFAVGYGAIDRPGGTADRAFHRVGSHARLKSRFARKEALNQKYIQMADRLGYVETIPDKTVDPEHGYPLLCTRTKWGGVKPTIPLNFHVQGTAMWWMMMAMIRCYEYLEEYNRDKPEDQRAYIALQVHDELVFDLPKGGKKNLPLVNKLRTLMEAGGEGIGIPTPVSMTYHPNNWRDEEDV